MRDVHPGTVVDFIPAADALQRDARWAYSAEVEVLGHPVACYSNSRYVCDLFADAFALCGDRTFGTSEAAGVLNVRVVVHGGCEGVAAPVAVRHVALDSTRLLLQSPGSAAIIDPERRDATATISAELASDREHFRRAFLDAMTLALVSHFDRHPLHASAIVSRDRAVLLAGPSGSGKSSLADVARSAGLAVLSEDTVWVQQAPAFRVWGLPRAVHLVDANASDGRKLALPFHDGHAVVCSAGAAVVCLLQRGSDTACLERIAAEELAEHLSQDVAAGFDRFPERHAQVVRALAAPGGWRLRLSAHPGEALPLLRRMLHEEP